MGLAPDLIDTWTPEQRERFLREWNNDEVILQANRGEKMSYDEMMDGDEPVQMNDALQLNRGEKRSYDEMLDGDDEPVQIGRGQDYERPFNIGSVTKVNIKKFRTTGNQSRKASTKEEIDRPNPERR